MPSERGWEKGPAQEERAAGRNYPPSLDYVTHRVARQSSQVACGCIRQEIPSSRILEAKRRNGFG